ncbi:MAG TPA: hypothetical protein VHK90_06645 [Thermoanaerobaculia bacterium]|nr:hypothetical protein [Thermoanaerobaculia bacterium]
MLAACAASHSRPKTPWRLELVSSGGFAGRGNGNYAIDSDANIRYETMQGKQCTFEATDAELARFTELLGNAKPETWKESYVPENSCCDRFEYELTVDEAGTKRTVRWIDDPLPMPPDLDAIADAIVGGADSIRVRYSERCR